MFSPFQSGIGMTNPLGAGGFSGAQFPQAFQGAAMGRVGGMDAMGGMDPSAGMMSQMMQSQQMLQQTMMEMLQILMMLMMGQQGGAAGAGSQSALGGVGSGSDSGSGSGSGASSGAGDSSGGGAGSADSGVTTGTGSGADAVKLAQSKLGQQAQNVQMANYSHAGGVTNDCADFVSGIIANTEGFHKTAGDASVSQFKSHLQQQGWKQVSREQAQPGDVAIIQGGGVSHTELVTSAGAKSAIGANGSSQETVKTDNLNWASGVTYFHKG